MHSTVSNSPVKLARWPHVCKAYMFMSELHALTVFLLAWRTVHQGTFLRHPVWSSASSHCPERNDSMDSAAESRNGESVERVKDHQEMCATVLVWWDKNKQWTYIFSQWERIVESDIQTDLNRVGVYDVLIKRERERERERENGGIKTILACIYSKDCSSQFLDSIIYMSWTVYFTRGTIAIIPYMISHYNFTYKCTCASTEVANVDAMRCRQQYYSTHTWSLGAQSRQPHTTHVTKSNRNMLINICKIPTRYVHEKLPICR